MAKKKTRKELLKGPDEFMTFSERAVLYVQDHSRAFVVAAAVFLIVIMGYVGVSWYVGFADSRAQEVYNKAYYAIREAETLGVKLEHPNVPVEYFEKLGSNHRLARVSKLAFPQLASLEFQQGNVDAAIEFYERFKEKSRRDKSSFPLTALALSASFEAKRQFDAAIAELAPIVADPESFLREQALFRLVRLHRLNGDLDDARKAYEKLAEAFPKSLFLPLAEGLLDQRFG